MQARLSHKVPFTHPARDIHKATAFSSVRGSSVGIRIVSSSTPAISAKKPTQQVHANNSPRDGRQCLPTPISAQCLSSFLEGYDSYLSGYLCQGFLFGLSLDFHGPPLRNSSTNLRSAFQHPDVVDLKLSKEINAGRVRGPYDVPPFGEGFNVSPIGLHPKKVPGEFRLIHHLSHPPFNSVNHFIPTESSTVQYASIDDAIASIQEAGPGASLSNPT
jgi:hypothetical protein